MDKLEPGLTISIATRGRAAILTRTLEKLSQSSLKNVEIDILIDGIDDQETLQLATELAESSLIPMRIFQFEKSGLAAVRNRGADIARYSFIRIQDDDDQILAPDIQKIMNFHLENDDKKVALLTYTSVNEEIFTPLMEFLTVRGGMLFGYSALKEGFLDFTGFWGGRISLSTNLLRSIRFDEELTFGAEDIEFAFRATKFGLKVHYDPNIKAEMIRELSIDDFLKRSFRQGYSNAYLAVKHEGSDLEDWATAYIDTRTLKMSCSEDLLLNIVRHARRFENLQRSELELLLGREWESYLSWLWHGIYRFSKELGFVTFQLGKNHEDVLSRILGEN